MERDSKGRFVKGHSEGVRFQKGFTPWNKGVAMTDEVKEKVSIARKGKKAWNYSRVECVCVECKTTFEISPALVRPKGNFCARKCFGKFQSKSRTGENHPKWIHDRSKLKRSGNANKDRRSSAYVTWRKTVWLRDNYTCKLANPDCKGRLEAHHILGYTKYPKLRYEVNNGITLCAAHHPRKRKDEKRLAPLFRELVERCETI